MVTTLLQPGAEGAAVRVLQERLAALHLFPNDQMNGVYGPLTEESVRTYQLARGIITQATDSGAGNVGPATLHMLQQEHLESLYRLVRAEGWKVL